MFPKQPVWWLFPSLLPPRCVPVSRRPDWRGVLLQAERGDQDESPRLLLLWNVRTNMTQQIKEKSVSEAVEKEQRQTLHPSSLSAARCPRVANKQLQVAPCQHKAETRRLSFFTVFAVAPEGQVICQWTVVTEHHFYRLSGARTSRNGMLFWVGACGRD